MKYPSRNPNPTCHCGHAYHSHGMPWWGLGIAIGGAVISLVLAMIFSHYFGYTQGSHTPDPRDWWILPASIPPMFTMILFLKHPFKKPCLLCKCPNFKE